MRLTCPNCEAQYEVPDEVIPFSGRDVQCSNCGDTWFQHHPDNAPVPDDTTPPDEGWDAPEPEEDKAEAEDVAVAEEAPEVEDTTSDDVPDEAPTRRELDPAVTDVLREEAERERAAREAEMGDGLETQPELGLTEDHEDEAAKRTREAQARMARLRGEAEDPQDDHEVDELDPGTRRNLLPDIDEIKSSLDSDAGNAAADMHDELVAKPKGGFRRGFLTMILLAVIGLLIYTFAPKIAGAVPALDGALSAYVELINQGRAWLDQTVGGLIGASDGMSGDGSDGAAIGGSDS